MDPTWINLLVQIPLVGAFILFTVLMADRVSKFLANQNDQWRETLKAERERRQEVMDQGMAHVEQLAQSIGKIADAVLENSRALHEHDKNAALRHTQIIERFERETNRDW